MTTQSERAQWEKVRRLLSRALNFQGEERDRFLDRVCADNPDLRCEIESLLEHDRLSKDGFLCEPFVRLKRLTANRTLVDPNPIYSDVGLCVGPYRLVRVIGQGGMGDVFLGVRIDGQIRRQVAVKILRRDSHTEEGIQRFLTERQIIAALKHPGVVNLFDVGALADGRPYFIMEYISGVPVNVFCARHKLTLKMKVELMQRVCDVVADAHLQRVLHRDLKPGNILVGTQGLPRLLDFGAAKILDRNESSQVWNLSPLTPDYASPEQLIGKADSPASDVWSLGVVFFEMLLGHRPTIHSGNFQLSTRSSKGRRSLRRSLPPNLVGILSAALHQNPEDRPQSARAFAELLRSFLEEYRPTAKSVIRPGPTSKIQTHEGSVLPAGSERIISDAPDKSELPSFLFLPLQVSQPDTGLIRFVDDLTDNLISRFDSLGFMKAVDRGAAFLHRSSPSPLDLARRLGATFVVTGTADFGKQKLMIQLTLGHARTGNLVSVEPLEFFNPEEQRVGDILLERLASKLWISGWLFETQEATEIPARFLQPWQAVLRSYDLLLTLTPSALDQARELLSKVITEDPWWQEPLCVLALTWAYDFRMLKTEGNLKYVAELSELAVSLGLPSSGVASSLAGASLSNLGKREVGLKYHRLAQSIIPGIMPTSWLQGHSLLEIGKPTEALELFDHARILGPNDPWNFNLLISYGIAHFSLKNTWLAIEYLKQSLRIRPDYPYTYLWLVACYGQLGQLDQAEQWKARLFQNWPGLTHHQLLSYRPLVDQAFDENLALSLQRVGISA